MLLFEFKFKFVLSFQQIYNKKVFEPAQQLSLLNKMASLQNINNYFHSINKRKYSSSALNNYESKKQNILEDMEQKNILKTLKLFNKLILENSSQIEKINRKISKIQCRDDQNSEEEQRDENTYNNKYQLQSSYKNKTKYKNKYNKYISFIQDDKCTRQLKKYHTNHKSSITHHKSQLQQTHHQNSSQTNNQSLLHKQLIHKLSQLEQKIQNFKSTLKKQNNQNQINLQRKLIEKAEKIEIQKIINLNKLIVIEIQQIKQRVKDNQIAMKSSGRNNHEIDNQLRQLKQKNSKASELNIDLTKQKLNKNKNQSLKNQIEQKIKEILKNQFDLKQHQSFKQLNAETKQTNETIKLLKQNIQNASLQQQKFKNQVHTLLQNKIFQITMNVQKQNEQRSKKQVQVNTKLKNITQQNKKFHDKLSKQIQSNFNKKLLQLQSKFIQKQYFDEFIQKTQRHINKLNQSFQKLQIKTTNKLQSLESTINLQKKHNQYLIQDFIKKMNIIVEEMEKNNKQEHERIIKLLNKYVKTEAMKKYFQEENQKVFKIINDNFQEQKLVNQTLCSQNIVARYLWQGQELKGGNLISWDKEIINTLPENFVLTSSSHKYTNTVIQISNSGIYKFELGFYAKKKPSIQILINGKIAMSAVNSSSYVIHHSSGKLKSIQPTQISGLTLVDFFLVPQKSRIAIAYSGQIKGQGFLNIHRL